MQLSDKDIYKAMVKGDLLFVGVNPKYPFVKEKQVQPASVDLRLGNRIIRFKENIENFDIKNIKEIDKYLDVQYINEGEAIEVKPNEILFAQIYEQISIPDYLSARVEGRSRVARLGISVHCTGDYINPGFAGAMPLQIINHNYFPVVLYPYISICQMILYRLSDEPLVSYLQRSVLPYNTYYNETNPSPSILSGNPQESMQGSNTILEKRIGDLIENYYNTIEKEKDFEMQQKISKCKKKDMQINKQALIEEATILNLGGLAMGDQYFAKMAGVQGKNAGSHATITQYYNENEWSEVDINNMLTDLEKIKQYIKSNYTDEEHDIIVGDISSASRALKSNNKEEAGNILKRCGHVLYDIAKSIGCAVVTRYLGNILAL